MSLIFATLLCAILILLPGLAFVLNQPIWRQWCLRFARSERAALVFLAIASGWFLYYVSQLGEADFGNHRNLLFLGFASLAILSFFYARDFLSVRAACVVYLLFAQVILSAAFMQEPGTRLLLVAPVYLGIVLALYLTISPFRVRDFFTWLYKEQIRLRLIGGGMVLYGLLLLVLPLTY